MTIYSPELEAQIAAWAESRIPPQRLKHVRGVVSTSEQLAQRYAPDQTQAARLAAWLHDAAKHLNGQELLQIAQAHQWPIIPTEYELPDLLHGAVGYLLANDQFDLNDPALQSACAYHTTGDPTMNTLDKIVFLGDLIEPSRNYAGVERLRELAEQNLDTAILLAIDITLQHLITRQRIIDLRPVLLRNQLLRQGITYPKS